MTQRCPVAARASWLRALRGCGLLLSLACGRPQEATAPTASAVSEPQATEEEAEDPIAKATRAIGLAQWERAESTLTAAMARGLDTAEAWYYLGVARQGRGVPEARECFQEALRRSPDLVEAWVNLSAAHLDASEFAPALEVAEQGLSRFPKEPLLLENRALALSSLDRPADAVAAYRDAVTRSPDNAPLRFALAQALFQAGQTEAARLRLHALTASDDPAVLASAARLLGKLKSYGPCIDALDKALLAQPSAELFVRRGLCHHGMHDAPRTLADFQAAVESDPAFAPAHYYLGMHLKQSGDLAAARAALTKARTLAGEQGVGRAARRALEALPAPQ